MNTPAFVEQYVGGQLMVVRSGTRHCYSPTEAVREAVCQLNWAYSKLAEPDVTFPNGRTSHECANELVDQHEDTLLSNTRVRA